MRVCEDHTGHLYLCHKVYAADFLVVLMEIRDFLYVNEKEIVILDLHGVIWSSGQKSTIADALIDAFGSMLAVKELNEPVSAFWVANQRVVVFYDGYKRFYPKSLVSRPWPRCRLGKSEALAMLTYNEQPILEEHASHMFFVSDFACSPTYIDILKAYFLPSLYPTSLRENNRKYVHPNVLSTMEGKWRHLSSRRFNIMMIDFVQEDVVNWVIAENVKASK